ncbi:MAG: hypothetical protein NTY44_08700 [Deltaproteobacteria bacterium]|nr:hypothetical protein [Deltaproteobacteria bacterium]
MNRKPELPVEIEKALRRYLEIQAEEQRLKEEKNDLRERIGEHMAGLEMKYWYPKIDGQALKVRYRETMAIEYNESLLHDRLGDRYATILAPDLRKIRLHLDKLESLFTPILGLIGSPVPEKVRVAIENGTVNKESFAGAFKKTVKRFVAVGRTSAGDTSDIADDSDGPQTKP